MHREPIIPTTIESGEEDIKIVELNRILERSQYGKALKENIRFSTFKPDNVSNEEWEKLLGADVNNFDHLRLSYGLARKFAEYAENPPASWEGEVHEAAQFDKDEQADLQLAAIIHDWAEAIVGDLRYGTKTEQDEKDERDAFLKITDELLADHVEQEVINRTKQVFENVAMNEGTKLGRAFNAIEHMGYVRTALNAWRAAKEKVGDDQEALRSNLYFMAQDVLATQIASLIEYAKVYPATRHQIVENSSLIDDIFAGPPIVLSEDNNLRKLAIDDEKWNQAKEAWRTSMMSRRT